MKLAISGSFAVMDSWGNIIREAGKETDYFCEILDGMEIDGVKFSLRRNPEGILITLEGDRLSDDVRLHGSVKKGPISQVIAKDHEAKFTSSVLNRFITKTHKILSKEPVNQKKPLANIILLRDFVE